jgi:hypothetical protein
MRVVKTCQRPTKPTHCKHWPCAIIEQASSLVARLINVVLLNHGDNSPTTLHSSTATALTPKLFIATALATPRRPTGLLPA